MFVLCTILIGRTNHSVLLFPECVFLSLLTVEMEGKEREREEN